MYKLHIYSKPFLLEWTITQCDGVTLHNYLNIYEDIAVDKSLSDNNIVEDVKKVNFGEVENEDEHVEKSSKLTKNEISNGSSAVKNGLRQQINIPDEISIKLAEVETFYEKITIYKNNKQTKLTDYFD